MSVVLLNKRRPDEYGLRFDAPPPPSSSEWFLDSQFVPGTDFAEDPWLDFETELKKHTMSQAAIFGCAAMALDVMEPPLRLDGVKQEEHSPEVVEQPASLSSSASLSAVLRTCHHCKTVRTCQPCVCSRTFCDRCIEKYPSIPQTPDPSGFRQQCPHCQELCTCARCRQRRAEESAPARARAQRSAAVKRQASEEDEDYGGARLDREVEIVVRLPDTLAPPAAAAAASTAADDEDLDACGSLKGDDVSLSPLGPCSSSSSCGSRISFKLRTSDDGMHHTVDRVVSLQQVKRLRTAPAALSQPLTTVAPVLCAPVAEQADQTSLRTSAKPEGSSDSGASDEPDNEESADEGYAPASADAAAVKSAARVKKARRPAEGAPRPRTMGRKGSVDGGAALPGVAAPTCKECGTRTTPLWRAGPDGTKSLCNRCGIRWMRGVPLTRSPPAKTCHAGAEEDASEARARQVPCK